jgi:hypothetical protein
LAKDYPWYTPYQFAGNMPIWAVDLDGLEEKIVITNDWNDQVITIKDAKQIASIFKTYYAGVSEHVYWEKGWEDYSNEGRRDYPLYRGLLEINASKYGTLLMNYDAGWRKPPSQFGQGLNDVQAGFGEIGQLWKDFAIGDSKDAKVARKTIGGIVGLALAIPSGGSSLSWIGWGSVGFSSNSLGSGIVDAVDDQDKDRNLLKEGSQFIGGEIGSGIYDYAEFGFGLISIGSGSRNALQAYRKKDLIIAIKETLGVAKSSIEIKAPLKAEETNEPKY